MKCPSQRSISLDHDDSTLKVTLIPWQMEPLPGSWLSGHPTPFPHASSKGSHQAAALPTFKLRLLHRRILT